MSDGNGSKMAGSQVNSGALWATWLRLYPLYCALAREFVIEVAPCSELEEGLDAPPAEGVANAAKWFALMDTRIHIHHLRHFAQTSSLMTEQAVANLLFHYRNKEHHIEEDRDKLDFLLVQLFSMRAPSPIAAADLTLERAAEVVEPMLGSIKGEPPSFANRLEDLIVEADRAKNLNALFTSRIIERSREIKSSCGEDFYQPVVMTAFARFGFLIRRSFFRLMQQDLNSILDGLRELESRGVTTIDCRRAQFSAEEPIIRIRMICQSWRVMFQAEYSSGQPLCLLTDLRTAVETALAQTQKSATAAATGSVGSSAPAASKPN